MPTNALSDAATTFMPRQPETLAEELRVTYFESVPNALLEAEINHITEALRASAGAGFPGATYTLRQPTFALVDLLLDWAQNEGIKAKEGPTVVGSPTEIVFTFYPAARTKA